MTLITSLALVILIGLSGYALYLYLQLRKLKNVQNAREEALAVEQDDRKAHYRKSIHVIASAIVADQVTLTEGAIRISKMAAQLDLPEYEREHYQVFFQLTEATAHIPIIAESELEALVRASVRAPKNCWSSKKSSSRKEVVNRGRNSI